MDIDPDTGADLRKSPTVEFADLIYRNPLTTYLLGVGILLVGSMSCEWLMANHGRDTPLCLPAMALTISVGGSIWFGFCARCFDGVGCKTGAELAKASGMRLPLTCRSCKVPWALSFFFASLGCLCLLLLVWTFECTYVKADPAEFAWSFGMISATLCGHWLLSCGFISSTLFVIAFSAIASRDDSIRQMLVLLEKQAERGLVDVDDLLKEEAMSQ